MISLYNDPQDPPEKWQGVYRERRPFKIAPCRGQLETTCRAGPLRRFCFEYFGLSKNLILRLDMPVHIGNLDAPWRELSLAGAYVTSGVVILYDFLLGWVFYSGRRAGTPLYNYRISFPNHGH